MELVLEEAEVTDLQKFALLVSERAQTRIPHSFFLFAAAFSYHKSGIEIPS